jgi:hypothetical protein
MYRSCWHFADGNFGTTIAYRKVTSFHLFSTGYHQIPTTIERESERLVSEN